MTASSSSFFTAVAGGLAGTAGSVTGATVCAVRGHAQARTASAVRDFLTLFMVGVRVSETRHGRIHGGVRRSCTGRTRGDGVNGQGAAGGTKQQKRGAEIKRRLSLTLALGGARRAAGGAASVICCGIAARLVSRASLILP